MSYHAKNVLPELYAPRPEEEGRDPRGFEANARVRGPWLLLDAGGVTVPGALDLNDGDRAERVVEALSLLVEQAKAAILNYRQPQDGEPF